MARDYTGQLNQSRAQSRKQSPTIKPKSTGKLGSSLGRKMAKAAEEGSSAIWPFVFIIAFICDISDLLGIGLIPIVGDVIDFICVGVLTGFLWNIGGNVKNKIRIAIWTAGFIEIFASMTVIFTMLELATSWMFAVIYAYALVKKRAKIGSKGMTLLKQGKISREAYTTL